MDENENAFKMHADEGVATFRMSKRRLLCVQPGEDNVECQDESKVQECEAHKETQ